MKKLKQFEFSLQLASMDLREREVVLSDIRKLIAMHRRGALGGAHMPEDVHPKLAPDSADLAHYFTFGMALNYQRNSYSLWRSCTAAWEDENCRWVFSPLMAVAHPIDELRSALVHHRVALQPNNHVKIWRAIAETLCDLYQGDVRNLFTANAARISGIKSSLALHKKRFPYLSGTKICNYWLYVMLNYTDNGLSEKYALNIAPDTHVINASIKLGVISPAEAETPVAREIVADRWAKLLSGTPLDPIDVHTPLWLWSRSGFVAIEPEVPNR